MKKTKSVAKTGRNDFHNYDYATEEDILREIRGPLTEEGLIILPTLVDEKQEGTVTTLHINFRIIDTESGEMVECRFTGKGEDKGDKGSYKAMTGAQKYFLTKTFMIPTGDDPERDDQLKKGKLPAKRAVASTVNGQNGIKASPAKIAWIKTSLPQLKEKGVVPQTFESPMADALTEQEAERIRSSYQHILYGKK